MYQKKPANRLKCEQWVYSCIYGMIEHYPLFYLKVARRRECLTTVCRLSGHHYGHFQAYWFSSSDFNSISSSLGMDEKERGYNSCIPFSAVINSVGNKSCVIVPFFFGAQSQLRRQWQIIFEHNRILVEGARVERYSYSEHIPARRERNNFIEGELVVIDSFRISW